MSARSETIAVLQKVFEADTAQVLTSPSEMSREHAVAIASEMPLEAVAGDAGRIAGMALADALEAAGLRPADYMLSQDAVAVLTKRLAQHLTETPMFERSFRAALKMRG